MRNLLALLLAVPVFACAGPPSAPAPKPIQDDSFLIEEAYNQERGVVQHINTFQRLHSGDWVYTFTQEWPVPVRRNGLSLISSTSSASPCLWCGWMTIAA